MDPATVSEMPTPIRTQNGICHGIRTCSHTAVAVPNYVLNHVASQCYLAGWTDDRGLVRVTRRAQPLSALSNLNAVGARKYFWGKDESVREAAEQAAGKIESNAGRVLPSIRDLWPIRDHRDEFFWLLEFMALHMVRTPQWMAMFKRVREESIEERMDEDRTTFGSELARFHAELLGDRFLTEALLGQINKVASVLGSMHLSLVTFDEPVLVTSDQPMTPVALGSNPVVESIPSRGLLETYEFRFPIDAQNAVVLLWLDEPDDNEPIAGTSTDAALLNVSTISQMDQEFFHHPTMLRPPVVIPPFRVLFTEPVGPRLFAHYSGNAARSSRRRAEAEQRVSDMIEREIRTEIRVTRVSRDEQPA